MPELETPAPSPGGPLSPSLGRPSCSSVGRTPTLRPTLRRVPQVERPHRWTWTSQNSREHNITYPYNCEYGQAKRQKFYAVALGKHPGIFLTWPEAKWLVHEFSGAKYEAFKSLDLAKHFLASELAMLPPLPPTTHRVNCEY